MVKVVPKKVDESVHEVTLGFDSKIIRTHHKLNLLKVLYVTVVGQWTSFVVNTTYLIEQISLLCLKTTRTVETLRWTYCPV